jgi:protein ImuA
MIRAIRRASQAAQALWIQTDYAVLEGGKPYGTGLDRFGLPLDRLLILRVARPLDALWGFEEALKSPSVAGVIAELPQDGAAADLTATRRLSLAARASNGLGILLRHREPCSATSAMTRWKVAAAPTEADRFGGLGRTAFDLSLEKNRRGRCGRFIVYWDHEARSFIAQAAASFGLPDMTRIPIDWIMRSGSHPATEIAASRTRFLRGPSAKTSLRGCLSFSLAVDVRWLSSWAFAPWALAVGMSFRSALRRLSPWPLRAGDIGDVNGEFVVRRLGAADCATAFGFV